MVFSPTCNRAIVSQERPSLSPVVLCSALYCSLYRYCTLRTVALCLYHTVLLYCTVTVDVGARRRLASSRQS